MGRLFWKFFFFLWVAQLLTSIGVGIGVWLLSEPPPTIEATSQLGSSQASSKEESTAATLRNQAPKQKPWLLRRPHPRSIIPPPLPIFLGCIVSFTFAAILAWYFSRPIRTMRSAFDSVANGELKTRIGKSMGERRDELADLGQSFDRMASRLQELIEVQRRFLHDISHELRSPLARLQIATDLIEQQPERTPEFIPRLHRDMGRIDTLVDELLTLARLDSSIQEYPHELINLNELLENIVRDALFEAEAKQCSVDLLLHENIKVNGNYELLYRALENVVRNAVQHSPPAKSITIKVTLDTNNFCQIDITNESSGVADAEVSKIFEPFFRGEQGREHPGHGLGLAIALRIIQVHGGTILASNREAGKFLVTTSLPAIF